MLLQRLEILGLAIGAVILSAHHINAQSVIVPDNTLGTETSIVTPSQDFESVTGGATRGTGLFHSFSQFNISDRGNVRFIVRPEIQNIFARVTGNNPSQILGTLGVRSDVAGELLPSTASLFLLNPNGILFGQNAKLDLGGAFVATTASSFKFGDQEFSTINPQTPPLLTINVPTGLQFGQKVGAIEVNRANLATNTGKGLSLIGGTVSSIDGSIVSNGGGELNITAFDQDALANLTFSTNGWKVSPNANAQFRDIQIDGTQVSLLTSNLLNPDQTIGNFYILGKSVNLAGKSFISYFHDKVNQPNIQPGTLVINATDAIQLDNSTLFAGGDSSMDTPGIEISARSLILRDGNIFLAQSTASPKAKITINASENILVSGASGRISGIGSFNFSDAKQLGEDIQITTGSLIVENGASIRTSTSQNSLGDAGGIAITSDTIEIAGEGLFPSNIDSTTILGKGDAGDVILTTRDLKVRDGAYLTVSGSQGKTGALIIRSKGSVIVSGTTKIGIPSRIGNQFLGDQSKPSPSTPQSSLLKVGIQIFADNLIVEDGAQITTLGNIDGNSKDIVLDLKNRLTVRGSASNELIVNDISEGFSTSQINTTKLQKTGDAGDIQIRAKIVEILEGGQIESGITSSSGSSRQGNPQPPSEILQGKVGDITIEASDSITISGTSNKKARSDINIFLSSSISNTISPQGYAEGGRIRLKTETLQVLDGGTIQADLLGRGTAGEIDIDVSGNVTVKGVGKDTQLGDSSSISSFSGALSQGNSGAIKIKAGSLNVQEGGLISVANRGLGDAGDIVIDVQDGIEVSGVSRNNDMSRIGSSTLSLTGQARSELIETLAKLGIDANGAIQETTGDGGNIRITANTLRMNDSAEIIATTDGSGKAGNIDINLRDRLVLKDRADILTRSQKTSGGEINLTAPVILLRNNSNIKTNVSSGIGTGGSITLTAPSGIILLEDSDLLAFSKDGTGGNISLRTPALFTRTYKPSPTNVDLNTLDQNGFIDINATGAVSGIITLPTLNPLQNNRPELPNTLIDPSNRLSRSCIARNPETGKFYITGAGGIPPQPGDPAIATYSTLPVQSEPPQIVEADNIYTLTNGKVIFGKACQ